MNVRYAALLCAVSLPVMAGTVSVNIAKMGGEGSAACSESKSDGTTASCKAVFTTGRATAISSYYTYGTGNYVWFGALHRTVSASSNITVTARGEFASEFANLGTGQGVTVSYDDVPNDLDPVNVYADDGFGNYALVGTVDPVTTTSLNVSYAGHPIKILLESTHSGVATTEDYAALFHVDLSVF